MKKIVYLGILSVMLIGASFMIGTKTVRADPPVPITFKGWVNQSDGTPVPDGVVISIHEDDLNFYDNTTTDNSLTGCNYLHSISSNTGHHVTISCSYNGEYASKTVIAQEGVTWCNLTLQPPSGGGDPPVISNPNPPNGATNVDTSVIWSVTIEDPEGDLINYTIECSNGQTTGQNGVTNGTYSLSLMGLALSTTYTVWVNATDGGNWTNATFTFTTRSAYTPSAPSFSASAVNYHTIHLSWSVDSKTDSVMVRRKTGSYPADRTDGALVYQGAATSYDDTGLDDNTKYYYSIWAYNSTDDVWSSVSHAYATTPEQPPQHITITLEGTDFANKGDVVRGYINITNDGGYDLTDVDVILSIQYPDVSFKNASITPSSTTNDKITWHFASLSTGDTIKIIVNLTVSSTIQNGTYITNNVNVTGTPSVYDEDDWSFLVGLHTSKIKVTYTEKGKTYGNYANMGETVFSLLMIFVVIIVVSMIVYVIYNAFRRP